MHVQDDQAQGKDHDDTQDPKGGRQVRDCDGGVEVDEPERGDVRAQERQHGEHGDDVGPREEGVYVADDEFEQVREPGLEVVERRDERVIVVGA